MTTELFIIQIALYIFAAIAQCAGEHTKQQPKMRRKSPGLHEWYVPPKSRNVRAHALIGSATAMGLGSVIVGYLMQ